MIRRYSREAMRQIWTEENKFSIWLQIEILACEARRIPANDLATIKRRAKFDVKRISEIERTTNHDVIAFLTNVAENVGKDSRFIHMGMTSSDVLDTALALESGAVRLSDTFDTTHPLEIGRFKIKDFEKENRNLNVAEIFTHSSNLGSARMAERFGGAKQRTFFVRLGLADKIPLELQEVGAPLLPSARDWGEGTTMTAAFGHGIAVNAVQLAAAIATIVNDGHPVHPTMLKRDATYEQDVDTVISPHTSALVRGLMRLVVTRGTAKKAEVEGYLVGGKTGTAEKLNASHKYEGNERRSSFVGLFPIDAPKYLVFAMLDNPKGNAKTKGFATAGWVVAPAIANVITQIGPLLGMAPLTKDMNEATERQVLKPLGAEIVDGIPVDDQTDYAAAESDSVQ